MQGKNCCHDGCSRLASKRQMCEMHYRQFWRANNYEHNKTYAKNYHQNIKKPLLKLQQKTKLKICLKCGIEFTRIGTNQKFCSKTCHNNISHRKKRSNPTFKVIHNLRSRLRKALKGKSRDQKMIDLIGCSRVELQIHLEKGFYGDMSWDNYGQNWHIDHIIPLHIFDLTDPIQLKNACHFSNLQPMSIVDHKTKSNIENSMRSILAGKVKYIGLGDSNET